MKDKCVLKMVCDTMYLLRNVYRLRCAGAHCNVYVDLGEQCNEVLCTQKILEWKNITFKNGNKKLSGTDLQERVLSGYLIHPSSVTWKNSSGYWNFEKSCFIGWYRISEVRACNMRPVAPWSKSGFHTVQIPVKLVQHFCFSAKGKYFITAVSMYTCIALLVQKCQNGVHTLSSALEIEVFSIL